MNFQTIMAEAARLSEDGEICNSDAIALLQIPHNSIEVRDVLRTYGSLMTVSAKSKLVLEAHAPLPHGVTNQRYEPIFDRYPLSGRTHVTCSGEEVLADVQYYNGHMMHIYGECSNIAAVDAELDGTGYKALRLRSATGHETVSVHVWAQQLSDTSIKPYHSMFLVVAAVPAHSPVDNGQIRGGTSGLASALSMLRGHHDPIHAQYENHARLYFARLYDNTQVAIDFGRELMGTDKRPGAIELKRTKDAVCFELRDGKGRLMIHGQIPLCRDRAAFQATLAQALSVAGINASPPPAGTEQVFHALARIGRGPLRTWQWRTDVTPSLHPIPSGTTTIASESDEGSMLRAWQFEPKTMGYIPNVRGVITGIQAPAASDANSILRTGAAHHYFRRSME